MGAEADIEVLANVCAVHDATLAKLIGLVMRELMAADPGLRPRLKTEMTAIASSPDGEHRELVAQIVKQAARSAGMRLPDL